MAISLEDTEVKEVCGLIAELYQCGMVIVSYGEWTVSDGNASFDAPDEVLNPLRMIGKRLKELGFTVPCWPLNEEVN